MAILDLANELPLKITFFKVRNVELEFETSCERTKSTIGAYITGNHILTNQDLLFLHISAFNCNARTPCNFCQSNRSISK